MKQKDNKILIQIECCTDCHSHSWCSHHDQSKYNSYFQHLREKIQQNIPDVKVVKNYVPQSFQKLGQKSNFGEHKYFNLKTEQHIFFPKFGAFEVYVKQILIFSKLKSGLWPKIDKVVQLVEQVVKEYRNGEDISKFSLDYRLRNDRQVFFVQTYRAQIIKQRISSQERFITNQNLITPGKKNFNLRKVLSKSRPKNQLSYNGLNGSAVINSKKFNLYHQVIPENANRPKTRDFNNHMNTNVKIYQDQKLKSAPNNVQIQQWNILQRNQASNEQKSPLRRKPVKTINRDSIRIKINQQSNKNSNIKKLIQKKGLQTNQIQLNNNVISKQQIFCKDNITNETKSPKLTKLTKLTKAQTKNHENKASHINNSNRQSLQQQKIKKKQKDLQIKQKNDNDNGNGNDNDNDNDNDNGNGNGNGNGNDNDNDNGNGNKLKSGSMDINPWSNKQTDSNLQTEKILKNNESQLKKHKKPSISQGIDQIQSYQNQFIIQNQQKLEHQSYNNKIKEQKNNNSKSAQNKQKQIKMREILLSNQKTIDNNNNQPEFQQVISQFQEQNKNNNHGSSVNQNQLAKSHNFKSVKNVKHQQVIQYNVIQQSVIIKKNQYKLQRKQKQQQLNKNRESEYVTVCWHAQFKNSKYQLQKHSGEQSQQYSQISDDPEQSIVKPLQLSGLNNQKLQQQQALQIQEIQPNQNKYQQGQNQIQQNNQNSDNLQDKVSGNVENYEQIEWQTYYKKNNFVLANSQQQQNQNQNIIENCIENQINIQIIDKQQGYNTQILQQNNKQHNYQYKQQHKQQHKQQQKQQQELLANQQKQQKVQQKQHIETNKIIYGNIQWLAKYQNNKYSLLKKQLQIQVQQLQSQQQLQTNQKQHQIQKQQQNAEQLLQRSQKQNKISDNQQSIVQQHQKIDNKSDENIRYWIAKYQNQSFILQQHK